MASEQKGLKIGLGEAGNKVRVRFFCWQHCLRLLNIGNTSSYPYTHSNAQESHFSCRYSKEAWRFANSNNNKSLELRELSSFDPCRVVVVTVQLLKMFFLVLFNIIWDLGGYLSLQDPIFGLSIYLYTLAVSPSLGGSRQHKRNNKTMGISLRSSGND